MSPLRSPWKVRTVTGVLGALLAASVLYGVLTWSPAYDLPPPPVQVDAPRGPDETTTLRWLDGAGQSTTASSDAAGRLVLIGVVGGSGAVGAALISIDGQPAKPFRLGASVVDGWVLRSVAGRQAVLGPASGGDAGLLTLTLTPPAGAKP